MAVATVTFAVLFFSFSSTILFPDVAITGAGGGVIESCNDTDDSVTVFTAGGGGNDGGNAAHPIVTYRQDKFK